MNPEKFKEELTTLINRHSMENVANIPDYMMAELIVDFIGTLGPLIKKRDRWMGYEKGPVTELAPRQVID